MKQKVVLAALSLIMVSAFGSAAQAECSEYQKLTLSRYADAGNADSKVATAEIVVTAQATVFKNLTGSSNLVVTVDGHTLNMARVGDSYYLMKSLRDVRELTLEFQDAPVKIGEQDMILSLFDAQHVRQDRRGCVYLVDGGEH